MTILTMTEAERLSALTKSCGTCDEVKPWADFYARTRWPDGTMRAPQSRCKSCAHKARAAQKRAAEGEDRERVRVRQRRWWAKATSSEEFLERERVRKAQERRRRGEVSGPYRPHRVRDAEETRTLPIGPFRDWLESVIAEIARTIPLNDGEVRPVDEREAACRFCRAANVDSRRLYAWRHEQKFVELDYVDAVGCQLDQPTLLRELYPEVYDVEAVAA